MREGSQGLSPFHRLAETGKAWNNRPIQYFSTTTTTTIKTKINKKKCYLDRLFSVGFLDDTDGGVGDQDQENNNGFDKGSARVVLLQHGEDERDTGGNKKDNDELILELLQNHLPERGGFLLGEFCFLYVSNMKRKRRLSILMIQVMVRKGDRNKQQGRRERESSYP